MKMGAGEGGINRLGPAVPNLVILGLDPRIRRCAAHTEERRAAGADF